MAALLKAVDQSRYVNSEHVAVYRVAGSDSDWFIQAYLTSANGFTGTGNTVQLSLSYTTEAEANTVLDKLAAALGILDVATIA